jgi:hypothetical protein
VNGWRAKLPRAIRDILPASGILLVNVTLMIAGAEAQISPGPLAKAHQSLNGPANCTECHAVSVRSPNFRCLDCHREIAAGLQSQRGMHAAFVRQGKQGCVACHSDHNGENFSLIHWETPLSKFDHAVTGFSLTGKHAGLDCRQCHTASNIRPAERALLPAKDLKRTYLGLSQSCVSCHEDKHRGQLGSNCTQCHTTGSWKAAQSFDHSKTKFPLTGAHLQVGCQQCHRAGTDGVARFTGIAFARCINCHSDPHHGSFQQTCESCHTTVTWKRVAAGGSFDHSRTDFPLLGKHASVACERCHRGADFKAPVAHALCSNCHADEHHGQFARRSDGGKCESCHTVNGFAPSTFTVANHQATGFPLHGKHAGLECRQCHVPAGKDTLFQVKFALCTDCHKDAHDGQFASAPHMNHCEHCHTELAFAPSLMTLAKHQATRFPLDGGHVATACTDCHKPMAESRAVPYHFASLGCPTCHADPHHGEFEARMLHQDRGGKQIGCLACHNTKSWSDLAAFDHSSTRFALSGSHRAVGCAECHQPPNLEKTMLHVSFRDAPLRCEGCHEDAHARQFASSDGVTRCAGCHTTMKWKPSLFDHEKTAFSLQGAHQNAKCEDCHKTQKEVAGREVLFYKPTPTACAACHGTSTSSLRREFRSMSGG